MGVWCRCVVVRAGMGGGVRSGEWGEKRELKLMCRLAGVTIGLDDGALLTYRYPKFRGAATNLEHITGKHLLGQRCRCIGPSFAMPAPAWQGSHVHAPSGRSYTTSSMSSVPTLPTGMMVAPWRMAALANPSLAPHSSLYFVSPTRLKVSRAPPGYTSTA